MQHFNKNEDQQQHNWWNTEMSILERADCKHAFTHLEEAGEVHRGTGASTTANMEAILQYLLEEKPDCYDGKINSKHDPTCHRYD